MITLEASDSDRWYEFLHNKNNRKIYNTKEGNACDRCHGGGTQMHGKYYEGVCDACGGSGKQTDAMVRVLTS